MADFRAEFLFCPLFEPDLSAYVSNPRVSFVLAQRVALAQQVISLIEAVGPTRLSRHSSGSPTHWANPLANLLKTG
jgi:hypothetical protein